MKRDLDRGELTWSKLGEEYNAKCFGEAKEATGVLCVPKWSSARYYKLPGHLLYCGENVNSFAYHLLMMTGFLVLLKVIFYFWPY